MENENKDMEEKGDLEDRELDEKTENNTARASWPNDCTTGSRHGVSTKLCRKLTNSSISAFLRLSITIETRNRGKLQIHIHSDSDTQRDEADLYSLFKDYKFLC